MKHRQGVVLVVLLLCTPSFATAGDLGMAGAISGAGQGMQQGLASMQSFLAQQALMEQQETYRREREERAMQQQRQAIQQARARELLNDEYRWLMAIKPVVVALPNSEERRPIIDQLNSFLIHFQEMRNGDATIAVTPYATRAAFEQTVGEYQYRSTILMGEYQRLEEQARIIRPMPPGPERDEAVALYQKESSLYAAMARKQMRPIAMSPGLAQDQLDRLRTLATEAQRRIAVPTAGDVSTSLDR